MELYTVKENDISKAQQKYRDFANYQNLSNNDKMKGIGLTKKLRLSDAELESLSIILTAAGDCRYHKLVTERYMKTLENLVNDTKCVDKEIGSLKLEVEHMNSQILRLEQSQSKVETIAISDNQYVFNVQKANINVKILENQLLVAQQKENNCRQKNGHLQTMIRSYCIERIDFNKVWVKTVDRLVLDKKMLKDMTDQAVVAFEKGAEYRKRMDYILKNANAQKTDQIDEMNAILRSLRLDTIRKKFFGNKMHRITMKELDVKENIRRNVFRKYYTETQNAYEITLNQVKLKAGKNRFNEIVAEFTKQKREYFSQFCYLNNLQLCVMQMNAVLTKIREKACKGKSKQVPTKKKDNAKLVVESNLAREKMETQESEERLLALNESLENYYHGLTKIVGKLNCDRTKASLVKGFENDEVHVHNVQTFLSMVDYRLKEIMTFVFYSDMEKHGQRSRLVFDVDIINYLLNEQPLETMVHECAECAMEAEATGHDWQTPLDIAAVREAMLEKAVSPEISYRMHSISQCDLPASRALIAKSMAK